MLIPFKDLSDESRVWIYQASRIFSKEEKTDLIKELEIFLNQWTAHGADLVTSYEIPYDGPTKSVFEKWLPFSKDK